jgi:hypothetical protein
MAGAFQPFTRTRRAATLRVPITRCWRAPRPAQSGEERLAYANDAAKNVVTYRTTSLPPEAKRHLVPAHSITLLQVGLAK